DLSVANDVGQTDSVSVLYGNGDGEFAAPRRFVSGPDALDVAAADFNGDGYDDLAVARQGVGGGVSVLLGDANGNLTTSFPLGMQKTFSVAVGDFNEDGHPDLAFGGQDTFNARVLLGDGSGAFGDPATFPASGQYGVVEVGDFNGDGHLDLVVLGDSNT